MARLQPGRLLKPLFKQSAALQRAMANVEAGLLGGVMAIGARVSVERASDFGYRLGRSVASRMRKDQNVRGNLAVAFPGHSLEWIAATSAEIWGQIGRSLAEFPHLPRITGPDLRRRFDLESRIPLGEIVGARTGYVFVGVHQANWNLLAAGGALGGFPVSVVTTSQNNEALERLIARYRDAMPCGIIYVADTVKRMVSELNAGRHVGLFIDHRVDNGEMVPFFGHPAATTTVAARIAAKLGTAMVPTRLERLPGVRFRLTFEEPVLPPAGVRDPREAAFDMCVRVNARFETWIRERPTEWCCVKRRWPKDVTEHARLAAGLITSLGDYSEATELKANGLSKRSASSHLDG